MEYFNPSQHFPFLASRFGVLASETDDAIQSYTQKLFKFRTTQNGWFGVKLHSSHLRWMSEIVSLEDLIPNAKHIVIDRREIIAQAVSHVIAGQTGKWYSHDTSTIKPVYSFKHIANQVSILKDFKKQWKNTLN